jgi:predicted RNA binding protein YcfA (HicA-like mRNA interferase family)
MKSKELHRLIVRNGWIHVRTKGSHFIYEKNGKRYPVPYHGSKEVGEGLRIKITKEMKLQ